MEISKELRKISKYDSLVSYGFNSFYPSAQIDINSIWTKKEITYPIKNDMNESFVLCLTAEDGMN